MTKQNWTSCKTDLIILNDLKLTCRIKKNSETSEQLLYNSWVLCKRDCKALAENLMPLKNFRLEINAFVRGYRTKPARSLRHASESFFPIKKRQKFNCGLGQSAVRLYKVPLPGSTCANSFVLAHHHHHTSSLGLIFCNSIFPFKERGAASMSR